MAILLANGETSGRIDLMTQPSYIEQLVAVTWQDALLWKLNAVGVTVDVTAYDKWYSTGWAGAGGTTFYSYPAIRTTFWLQYDDPQTGWTNVTSRQQFYEVFLRQLGLRYYIDPAQQTDTHSWKYWDYISNVPYGSCPGRADYEVNLPDGTQNAQGVDTYTLSAPALLGFPTSPLYHPGGGAVGPNKAPQVEKSSGTAGCTYYYDVDFDEDTWSSGTTTYSYSASTVIETRSDYSRYYVFGSGSGQEDSWTEGRVITYTRIPF